MFVRDWRQLLHSKGYIILAALVYVIAWIVFCSADWQEVYEYMRNAHNPVYCWGCSAEHVHDEDCYGLSHVCNRMECLNTVLALCAMGVVALLIPLRVGNAVSTDTRVKGTNFLQVTPLNSWRIVWGMWLSAFSQVLLVLALALPLVLARYFVMPTGNEADLYGLYYLALAGGIYCAVYMFVSGLNNFLRFPIIGGLIISGIIFALWTTQDQRGFCPMDLPVWVLALHGVGAALLICLFLQLTRRFYAAPAENMALPVRWCVIACVALGLVCQGMDWWMRDEYGNPLIPDCGPELPCFMLLLLGLAGALFDSFLPVVSLPVHAKRTVSWLPTWPQMPGMLQSACFLFIPFCALASLMLFGCGCSQRMHVLSVMASEWSWCIIIAYLAQVLVLICPVVLCIAVADCFVRRVSNRRPLVIVLCWVALFIFFGVLGGVFGSELVPFMNMADPAECVYGMGYRLTESGTLEVSEYWTEQECLRFVTRHADRCITVLVISIVELVVAFGAMAVRLSSTRPQR